MCKTPDEYPHKENPRKGIINPGLDTDVIIVDVYRTRDMQHLRCDLHTAYTAPDGNVTPSGTMLAYIDEHDVAYPRPAGTIGARLVPGSIHHICRGAEQVILSPLAARDLGVEVQG